MASRFCQQQQVDSLFYSQQYELNERLRDDALAVQLSERAITCQSFHDSVLLAPGTVLTGNNEMYKVFTPFRRAFIQRLLMSDNHCVPAPKARHVLPFCSPLPLITHSSPLIASYFLQGKTLPYSVYAVLS